MEPESFAAQHGRDLLALALGLTGNRGDAEDLLQDTYVRLLRAWSSLERADMPYAYARRTLVNTFLNARRRTGVVTLFRDGNPPQDVGRTDEYENEPRPASAAVQTLPPKQRAVIALRYLADMSDADIAVEMGIGRTAVRSHASRGLATLRAHLAAESEEALDA